MRDASGVRYYSDVNLGVGGLARAYTDCIAQALLGAEKTPIVRRLTLRCALPYALEGMARRELQAAGGTLRQMHHPFAKCGTMNLHSESIWSLT